MSIGEGFLSIFQTWLSREGVTTNKFLTLEKRCPLSGGTVTKKEWNHCLRHCLSFVFLTNELHSIRCNVMHK